MFSWCVHHDVAKVVQPQCHDMARVVDGGCLFITEIWLEVMWGECFIHVFLVLLTLDAPVKGNGQQWNVKSHGRIADVIFKWSLKGEEMTDVGRKKSTNDMLPHQRSPRFTRRFRVQNLRFRFHQSLNLNTSMGFRSKDLMDQTPNCWSGSGSNPVLEVQEPDCGQSRVQIVPENPRVTRDNP